MPSSREEWLTYLDGPEPRPASSPSGKARLIERALAVFVLVGILSYVAFLAIAFMEYGR